MMKRMNSLFFRFINFLVIFASCFVSGNLFISCDTDWGGDFATQLAKDTQSLVTFYAYKEGEGPSGTENLVTSKGYIIGSKLTKDNLPSSSDKIFSGWSTISRIGGWKYYRQTGEAVDSNDPLTDTEIKSLVVTSKNIDLYAIWHTQYKVIYKYQNTDGSTYEEKSKICYGVAGESTSVTAEEIPGFNTPNVSNSSINSDGSTEVEVVYDRKTVTITLDINDGSWSGTAPSLSGLYGADVTELTDSPTKNGYDFAGWEPAIPATYPAENMTCVAKYTGKTYKISYSDQGLNSGSESGKNFTGKTGNLPVSYKYGEETIIPAAVTSISINDNSISFLGWYTENSCDDRYKLQTDGNGNYIIPANQTGNVKLYAKWKPRYIYVDPDSGSTMGSGFDSDNALKTVKDAKAYIANCDENNISIVALSTISKQADIDELSNLTTDVNKFAILEKSSGFKGKLLDIPDGSTLSGITIEGVRGNSNSEIISVSGDVTLSNVIIQNFNVPDSTGVIKVNGNLTCENLVIMDCNAKYGIYCDSQNLTLSFKGDTKLDSKNKVYLGAGCSIKIDSDLTETSVATIYAENYTQSPQVLNDDGNGLVAANYTKFNLAHAGYAIDSTGHIVKSTTGGIEIEVPEFTTLQLGELLDTTAKIESGDATVKFEVNTAVIDKIKETQSSSGQLMSGKFVRYSVIRLTPDDSGSLIPAPDKAQGEFIVVDGGDEVCEPSIKGSGDALGGSIVPGIYSITFSAESNDSSVVFEPLTYTVIVTY